MRAQRPPPWAVPLLAAVAVALVPVAGDFTFDDPRAIVDNPAVSGAAPVGEIFRRDFWGTPIRDGVRSYRPLVPLVWRGLYRLWPRRPLPFRLLSLVAHVACVAMLMLLLVRLGVAPWTVFWTGLLFAVHGVHAEALGSIVAAPDIIATLFGLGALHLALRSPRPRDALAAALVLALACLAKESAFIFGVAAILAVAVDRDPVRERLLRLVPIAAVTVADVLFQLALPRLPSVTIAANNIAFAATHPWQRLGHALYVIGRGLSMCFVPIGLAPLHSYAAIDLSPATLLPYALPGALVLAVGIAALVVALRRRAPTAVVAVAVLFGPLVLQSSLLVPVINELAERMLYPASAAACALLVVLVEARVARPRLRAVVLVAIAVAFTAQLVRVARAWRSDVALWTYAVRVEPRTLASQSGYGTALIHQGHWSEAAWHRMIERYIERSYPQPVDWTPVERLEASPLDVRLVEGPGLFAPAAPCDFAGEWLRAVAAELPDFAHRAAPVMAVRYGCAGPR